MRDGAEKERRCTYAKGEPASSLRSQPGGKDGDGWVEGGAAFSVYSSETVSPGSHFGSDVSQQALTFRYYAQLS